MFYNLNEDQQKAVNSNSKRLLCLAGAGTGKTRTLIERNVRLVKEGVNPKSILNLTFTNAAAFEMKSRYREYISDGESPEFRTFHSYCYDLMSKDQLIRRALGYSTMPEIADEKVQKRIDKEALVQSGIRFTKKQIEDPSSLDKTNMTILDKCKKRLMRKNNVITFDELCSGVCNLFIENSPLVDKYKSEIKYLQVDEYQDTDQIQHDFVMSFKDNASLFVIGDILQSLYRFRNAVPEIMKSLVNDLEWDVIRLKENYRSTKQICDFANVFSKSYADDDYRIPIHSDRDGRPVDIRTYHSFSHIDRYQAMFDRIAFECKNVIRGSVAIIARTNAECYNIQQELDRNNIQYATNHHNVDVRYLLPSATDTKFMINWLATFLPSEQYSEFIRSYAKQSSTLSGYTEKMFLDQYGLNRDIESRMEVIRELRSIINSSKTMESKCKNILQTIGYPNLDIYTVEDMSMSDLTDRIVSAVESGDKQESHIYVGTIHSVKGLEFDVVYVIGVGGSKFKLDSEDNKNVYYVAMTRAKNDLVIYT